MRKVSLAAALAAAAIGGPQLVPAQSYDAPAAMATSGGTSAADLSYRQRNFSAAIAQATQGIDADPSDHVAFYLRGSARVEEGLQIGNAELVKSGVADSREAIRLEGNGKPDYYLPYVYGMTMLSRLEKNAEFARTASAVVNQVQQRAALTPSEESNLRYQQAMAELAVAEITAEKAGREPQPGEYRPVVDALSAAIKNQPQHLASRMLLADIYVRAERHDDAKIAFEQAIEIGGDSPVPYNNRGMYLRSRGDMASAMSDFDAALKADPTFYQAATNRGFTLMQAGRTDEAIQAFDASLRINPQQPGAISLRATTLLNKGDLARAIGDYREVLRMDPKNPMASADLGFANFFAGQYAAAARAFGQAEQMSPKMSFLSPWRYYSLKMAGLTREAGAVAAPVEAKRAAGGKGLEWPDLLTMYLAGSISGQDLVDSANKTDEDVRAMQLTEAYYFVGLRSLKEGDADAARPYLERAATSRATNLSAQRGAKIALRTMTVR